jgi:predicted nucleic acid-binding protein
VKRYLIDTSVLAAGLLNRPGAVQLLRPWISRREAATSILVYGEVVEYISGFANFRVRHSELRVLLAEVTPYFITYSIMARYAALRRWMRGAAGPGLIGDVDTLIAATALERDLTVVTTDGDFQRVPGLRTQLVPRSSLRTS